MSTMYKERTKYKRSLRRYLLAAGYGEREADDVVREAVQNMKNYGSWDEYNCSELNGYDYSYVLSGAFYFAQSAEGVGYWSMIQNEINRVYEQG